MKKSRFISLLTLSLCFCVISNAQTTYKNVTIDRDRDETSCVIVNNANDYPVQIHFQYKVGSQDAPWQDYPYGDEFPPRTKERYACVGEKIYGLKLTYVDILQPSTLEKIMDGVDAFATGYMEAKQKANNK